MQDLSPAHAARVRPFIPAAAVALATLAGLAQAQQPLEKTTPPPQQPQIAPKPPAPPPKPEAATVNDGPSYEVSAFVLRYPVDQPDRPGIDELLQLEVTLAVFNGVYVAPREGGEQVTVKLEDLASVQKGMRRFSVSAINTIGARIVRALNDRGIIGVLVAPDPSQIDPQTLEDKRPATVRTITLDIWTRSVKQVRTLGAGQRWSRPTAPDNQPSAENRVNHPYHQRIRENSPLQPAPAPEAGQPEQPGDLLRKEPLENYLDRLNRHPGRRVDVAIAGSDTPGDIDLDYIVTENKPWTAYFQVSNTGTRQTSEWRERFGFVHNQLTGRDDILSLDYITAAFSESNEIVGSYNAPILGSQTLRVKVFGSYSDYRASDVGFAEEKFKGSSAIAGGELIANILQFHQTFVDVFGGARYENQKTVNQAVAIEGQTDFFIPYGGARFERNTLKSGTSAEARIEGNVSSVAGTDAAEVEKLGRINADKDWIVFRGELAHSFYLEPLLFGSAWSDPASPDRKTTLAHEIALSVRGQYAFGHRLIPQHEDVVGGLYTVRGYPESLVAGDNSVIGTAEYRFHLPRALAIQPDPSKTPLFGQPFRVSPDQRYGRPDWDLVLKGFIDAGRVTNSDRESFEKDETLVGAGVGVDLVFRQNLNIRVDWGFALKDAADVTSGSNRLHLVATLLY